MKQVVQKSVMSHVTSCRPERLGGLHRVGYDATSVLILVLTPCDDVHQKFAIGSPFLALLVSTGQAACELCL